ncbi:MAG: hypothetical protein ACI8QZ_003226 [Chlamydiales bacterium]|jgi:hypothetical protein
MLQTYSRLFSFLGLSLAAPLATAGTLFVDADLATGANDGSTWSDAFQGSGGLQLALTASVAGDQIFVAEGTYLPAVSGRGVSFNFRTGVELYGSFLGTEAAPGERPPFGTAPSVLQGDLLGDDGSGMMLENSYHLLRGGGVDQSAVLDGFTVTGGNANGTGNNDSGGGILCVNGASPTVRNCHFISNRCTFGGGAGYINNGSMPTFTDCIFEDNAGGSFGGAFDMAGAGALRFDRCVFIDNRAQRAGALEIFSSTGIEVTNCTFQRNTATGGSGGGALWIGQGSNARVINCSIVDNDATAHASGGIRVQSAAPVIRNSILWNNRGPGGEQNSINQVSGGADVAYCIVNGGFSGAGNLGTDPQFVDALMGDLRVTLASLAIDAGDNGEVLAGVTLDLAQSARFVDEPDVGDTGLGGAPVVDMGAYESALVVTASYCQVSPNSAGAGAMISSTGSTSISGNGFSLVATGVVPGVFGVFFYGSAQIQAPFGDGLRCVGSGGTGTHRLFPLVQADGSGVATRALDFTTSPLNSGSGAITPGSTWQFQLWFRDNAAGASGFNTSDGLSATFAP